MGGEGEVDTVLLMHCSQHGGVVGHGCFTIADFTRDQVYL